MDLHDGLALCALLHAYDPASLDYAALRTDDALTNLELAFSVAEARCTCIACMYHPSPSASAPPFTLHPLPFTLHLPTSTLILILILILTITITITITTTITITITITITMIIIIRWMHRTSCRPTRCSLMAIGSSPVRNH